MSIDSKIYEKKDRTLEEIYSRPGRRDCCVDWEMEKEERSLQDVINDSVDTFTDGNTRHHTESG